MNPPKMLIAAITVALFFGSWALDIASSATSPDAGRVAATGDMNGIRFDHAAALLPNGQVLIVGGIERNGVVQPTVELFDPATGRFSPTGKPRSPHGWGVTATALGNGKVLVAGGSTGCDSPCYTSSAELYDPSTRTFTLTGNMTARRAEPRALLLSMGDVLFVGGSSNSDNSAEVYHVATGSFSSAGATHVSDPAQLLLLKDGEALVIGSSGADIYDPSTGHFRASGTMTVPRGKFGAALLPDGRVLVAGGQTGGARGPRVTSTEIYDPTTGRFAPGPDLSLKRFKLNKAVVALKNGRILIAGGADQPEVYDPASGKFLPVAGTKLDGFCFSTATVLNDGRVLLAGGYANPGGAGVNHAWIYQP
jgi:WD40 repeat protein